MKRFLALALMLAACGGGGGDAPEVLPNPPASNTNSGNCAVNIGGDFVVCLDGDCNNAQPIEEPIIEEPAVEVPDVAASSSSSAGSDSVDIPSKARVLGKVSGTIINVPMCSDVTINQIETTTTNTSDSNNPSDVNQVP